MRFFLDQTKMKVLTSREPIEDIREFYSNKCDILRKKISEFQERDSGWTMLEISHLEISINKHQPISGSHYISLPFKMYKMSASADIQNTDVYCFKWAIISALYSVSFRENLFLIIFPGLRRHNKFSV